MKTFLRFLRLNYKVNEGIFTLSIFKQWKIYTEWKKQIDLKKSPIELELPWITVVAKNYIQSYLKRKNGTDIKIFEYGSGGSSLFFLKYAKLVVSVEHDEMWFNSVYSLVKGEKINNWEGHLIQPNRIENTECKELDASNPSHYYTTDDNYKFYTFKDYASYIDNFPDNYFDLVLIDGRSRPSCLIHSIKKIKIGGLLVLDNAEREYYLSNILINPKQFILKIKVNGALICTDQFTQTNIYLKKT